MRSLLTIFVSSFATVAFAAPCDMKQCSQKPKDKECACAASGMHGGHAASGMHGGHADSDGAHGLMGAIMKLGLSEEQKKQVEAIHAEYAARHHNPDAPMKPEDMSSDHKAMMEKIKAILTEEQKKKLAELTAGK